MANDINDRLKKISQLNFADGEKQIYEWVKTNVLSLKDFRYLIQHLIETHPNKW